MPRKRQRNFRLGGGGERRGDAGHDLEGDAGLAQRRHFLAGAPEDERIAGLQPHDAAAGRGLAHEERVDLVLAGRMGALALADIDALRVAAAHGDDRLRHQPVVHDDVGFLQDALGAQRQQVRRARARRRPARQSRWSAPSDWVSSREASRRASSGRPASAASATRPSKKADQKRRRGWPFGSTRSAAARKESPSCASSAELRRQHRLDAGAEFLRKHRAGAGRGDRHGDRRAVDDGRRVEIAELGDIDGVRRDVPRPRRGDDLGVAFALAAGGEDENRAVEIVGAGTDGRDAPPREGVASRARSASGAAETRRISASVSRSRRSFAAASAPSPTTSTTRPATL